jgi:diacylglycerol kinase (ATP)
MSFAIIINPVSGGARPAESRDRIAVAASVCDLDGSAADVLVTERAGQGGELTRAALARGARLVFAWGGDGTINEVASALAFGEVPLAIIPAGSGNGLALELGIERRPDRAIARALAARPRRIDVGELGGRLFVNIAGVGFDAHVASRFNGPGNVARGFANYLSIGGRALLTYKALPYTVTTGGARFEIARGVLISIANSPQFGNGARIAPGARIDDGLLDLVVVDERSRTRTVCGLPRLFNGTVERIRGCTIRRIEQATIASAAPMTFHVDGEPVEGSMELQVRVHPGALMIAV